MDMVEKVAEAIWQADSIRILGRKRGVHWDDAGEDEQRKCLSRACAAIEAMREPTEAMVREGRYLFDVHGIKVRHENYVRAAWETMIRTALAQPSGSAPEKGGDDV